MSSFFTVEATSAVAETSATNEENQGGYGSKNKLMHDGCFFNGENDGRKAVQYNCIKSCGKQPVCSAQIRISKIDGSIVEKAERGNICLCL